jgi:hypothetical protein
MKNQKQKIEPQQPGMADLRKTLIEMCRPFGTMQHWEVESANDGLYRCIVRLEEPRSHALFARTLGGHLCGQAVCLDIRLHR